MPEPWDAWWRFGREEYCAKGSFFPRFFWCFFANTLFLFVYNALSDTRGEPEYILTVPKRGYQLLQPPVPLADDEDGSPVDAGEQLTESQSRLRMNTVKKIAAVVGVLLVAAVIEVSFERWLENADCDAADDRQSAQAMEDYGLSIAVLPFDNMSSDAEQEFFSDGISEELLNLLAKFPDLRVISRTSSFTYKNKNIDVPTIASELRVTHVLEGSVRRSGDVIRITAQLIDAQDDSHIWYEIPSRHADRRRRHER